MTPRELHDNAMLYAQRAVVKKAEGDKKQARKLNEKAFKLETDAAVMLKDRYDCEPTRSVVFLSAATLAFELKDFESCQKLIALGISEEAPEEIWSELDKLRKKCAKKSDHSRKITVKIHNSELDAIEDYLMIKLTKKQRKQARKKILNLWGKLCRKFDK